MVDKLFSSAEGKSLYSRTIEAITSTRKTNRISPSVILQFLQTIQKYPEAQILAGMRTYLKKECAGQGKGEKYLLAIIRNQQSTPFPISELKSTGSPLLDKFNRGEISVKEPNSL
jgi:hypothetical protein